MDFPPAIAGISEGISKAVVLASGQSSKLIRDHSADNALKRQFQGR